MECKKTSLVGSFFPLSASGRMVGLYVFQCNAGFVSHGMYLKMQIGSVFLHPVLLFLCV